MVKNNGTCLACKYYIPTLYSDSTQFHIHDYCEAWGCKIPSWFVQSQLCAEAGDDVCVDCEDCINSADDIEMGRAYCWCFKEK